MTLGIIFILLVALVGFVHYLQGFFSSIISAVIAILSALLAVGWHENILAMLKPGKFADLATALILCGLFVVSYVTLRITFDKLIPGNVRVKSTFDKIGGAAMGLVAGIFTVGLLAVALQSMPLGPSIGGYTRYLSKDEGEVRVPMLDGPAKDRKIYDAMQKPRFDPADQSRLLLPVDDMLVGLVNSASNGSLSANSFGAVHPDWLQELYGQRLGIEIGARHSANNLGSTPEISVNNLYFVTTATDVRDAEVPQVRGEAALENAPPGKAIPKNEGPMVKEFKATIAKRPAFVVRTEINHNATDADNLFRVSLGAVRLVVKAADGTTKNYFPIGTVDETGTFFLNRVDDPIVATSEEAAYIDFAFDVPADEVALGAEGNKDRPVKPGTFFEVKRLGRVDLSDPPRTITTVAKLLRVDPLPKDPVLRKSLIKKPPVKPGA